MADDNVDVTTKKETTGDSQTGKPVYKVGEGKVRTIGVSGGSEEKPKEAPGAAGTPGGNGQPNQTDGAGNNQQDPGQQGGPDQDQQPSEQTDEEKKKQEEEEKKKKDEEEKKKKAEEEKKKQEEEEKKKQEEEEQKKKGDEEGEGKGKGKGEGEEGGEGKGLKEGGPEEPGAGEMPGPKAGGAGGEAAGTEGLGAGGAGGAEAGAAGAEAGAAAGGEAAAAAGAEAAAAGAGEAAAAGGAVAGAPILLIILAVLVVILIIVMIIFGVMACHASRGAFGKSTPIPAGASYVNTKKTFSFSQASSQNAQGITIAGYKKIGLNSVDSKYIEDGLADQRLMDIMKYLGDRHLSLGISHIISGYQDMTSADNPESGAKRDNQIISNVSNHKAGLATDVATIDFVYKTIEPNPYCGKKPPTDVVWYSDAGIKIGDASSKTAQAADASIIPASVGNEPVGATDYENLPELNQQLEQNVDLLKKQLDDPNFLPQLTSDVRKKLKDKLDRVNSGLPDEITFKPTSTNDTLSQNSDSISQMQKKIEETVASLKTNTSLSADQIKTQTDALAKMEIMVSFNKEKWQQINSYTKSINASLSQNLQSLITSSQSGSLTQNDLDYSVGLLNNDFDGAVALKDMGALNQINGLNGQFNNLLTAWNKNNIDFTQFLSSQPWKELPTQLGNIGGLKDLGKLDVSKIEDLSKAINLDNVTKLGNLNDLGSLGDPSSMGDLGTVLSTGSLADLGALGNLGGLSSVFGGGEELLRHRCAVEPLNVNTTWGIYPAEAIPIKVTWQDNKPNATYVSTDPDDCNADGADVCQMVYRPEARRKAHILISEALRFPYDMGNKDYYHVVQLITFSNERDVQPFWDEDSARNEYSSPVTYQGKAIYPNLKDLYGLPRNDNFGLFAMPESWSQVHISY